MKHFLIACLFLLVTTVRAEAQNSLALSFGFNSSTGLVGIMYDHAISNHHAVSIGAGLGIEGTLSSPGYRYMFDVIKSTPAKSVWEKCFFLFECNIRPYVGADLSYSSGSDATRSSSTEGTREYSIGKSLLGNVTAGLRELYSNGMFSDLEFGYRIPITTPEVTQTSGPEVSADRDAITQYRRGLSVRLSIGYRF